jgi:hypothetical protein
MEIEKEGGGEVIIICLASSIEGDLKLVLESLMVAEQRPKMASKNK